MRILVTGASGFIGGHLCRALEAAGHTVVRVLRKPPPGARDTVQADFADVPPREWWQPQLAGMDAVVNAVGILRENGRQTFDALHHRAPAELFAAAHAAGVPVIVQVSALGVDDTAFTAYQRSKKGADDALRALPVAGAVVQPSAVYGPGGSSTAMFDLMARAPLLALPDGGRMLMQPVHVDDVVAGIVAVLGAPPKPVQTLHFAGPEALSFRDFLARLRTALGVRSPLRTLPMPASLFRLGASMAGIVPASPLDADTAAMLLAGNHTSRNALPSLLGRPPRAVEAFRGGA